jgi:hypothetical protein
MTTWDWRFHTWNPGIHVPHGLRFVAVTRGFHGHTVGQAGSNIVLVQGRRLRAGEFQRTG